MALKLRGGEMAGSVMYTFGLAQVALSFTRGSERFIRIYSFDTVAHGELAEHWPRQHEAGLTYSEYHTANLGRHAPRTVLAIHDADAIAAFEQVYTELEPFVSRFQLDPAPTVEEALKAKMSAASLL